MRFTKMHGLGNDYIYVDCFEEAVKDPSGLAIRISDRHFGAGSDGLVLIQPSDLADVRMRIFNPDGSEAQICGNALRCVAKYLVDRGRTPGPLTIETLAGIRKAEVTRSGSDGVKEVRVDMGEPRWLRKEIPMTGGDPEGRALEELLEIPGGGAYPFTVVSMGNPHAVLFVPDTVQAPVTTLGPQVEHHPAFPARTNVEFVQVLDRERVKMRVWERGTGETLACGSGACATAVASIATGRTGRRVEVQLAAGSLHIDWDARDNHVYMTGPAEEVFQGTWSKP